jgi:hypothetical protein
MNFPVMKNIIVIFTLLIFSNGLCASPQLPDYLIYKNDTIPIYRLILEEYLNKNANDQGNLFGYKFRDEFGGGSVNCWRGYQAIYEISNDSLFLKHIISCGEKFKSIDTALSDKEMLRLFTDKHKKGKVFIDWYSGNLSIQDGELLRWDGVFNRTFEKEKTFHFSHGKLTGVKKTSNYIDDPKRLNRKFEDKISDIIFEGIKNVKWESFKDYNCSYPYTITIGKNGEVEKVVIYLKSDSVELLKEVEYCTNILSDKLKKLKFDIIKSDGIPIEENVLLHLWVNDDGTIENWTN